jgi:RIO kinase 1
VTQDFQESGGEKSPSRHRRYRYDATLDPDAGRLEGLRGRLRSQGRDHVRQLDTFFDRGAIAEVLYLVRIGKEASVYCCRAGRRLGPAADVAEAHGRAGLVAAKVYRARQYRFKDDAIYQEERTRGMRGRARRALAKKSTFGRDVQTGSWVEHEFETLQDLYAAGCDVPRPFIAAADSILMEFAGNEEGPAPQLNRVQLDREVAEVEFQRVMSNVETALACNRVHGDLSAHNILYWDGRCVLIDFPQAVDPRFNSQAERLLRRDVDNVCRYFNQYGLGADPGRLASDLWRRWTYGDL